MQEDEGPPEPEGSPAATGAWLSPLEVWGAVSALEDCVDQLRVLAFTEGKQQVEASLQVPSLAERFGSTRQKNVEAMDWVGKDLPSPKRRDSPLVKLQRDRAYVERVVQLMLAELLSEGTFVTLEEAVARAAEVRRQEDRLLADAAANSGRAVLLRRQVAEETLQRTAQLSRKDEQIARIKDEIQVVVYQSHLEQDYLQQWEVARCGQNELRRGQAEKSLSEQVEGLRAQLHLEMLLHDEKHNFLMQEQANTEKKLEHWMAKYYEDTDAKAEEISTLTEKRRQNQKRLEELQQLFQRQQLEMEAYLAVKDEHRMKRDRELQLNAAATRIQSWWRGTMVRRGLGPYKRRRTKDKDKTKSKKVAGKK